MSDQYNHPQQPPQQPGFQQPGNPQQQGQPQKKSKLPWIVAAVALVLVLAVGGIVLALTGGDAESVEEVADQAVEAAEDLDVDAGIDLLCDAPNADERAELEDVIDGAKEKSGDDEPDADYEISDVEGDQEGSFVVSVTSDDPELSPYNSRFRVDVESDDGRSCIAGFSRIE